MRIRCRRGWMAWSWSSRREAGSRDSGFGIAGCENGRDASSCARSSRNPESRIPAFQPNERPRTPAPRLADARPRRSAVGRALAGRQARRALGAATNSSRPAAPRSIRRCIMLAARGLPRARALALDFGCGAGRLSRALAAHFEHVVGVDVSASMIETARALNRRRRQHRVPREHIAAPRRHRRRAASISSIRT